MAGGLLALAVFLPDGDTEGADLSLSRHSYPGLGFSVATPVDWVEQRKEIEGRQAVTFHDPEMVTGNTPRRGFHVLVDDFQFARVAPEIERIYGERFESYARSAVSTEARVDSRPAVVHEFEADGVSYVQWWIKRGDNTFRLEFWAPTEFPAAPLNDAVLDSFRVL